MPLLVSVRFGRHGLHAVGLSTGGGISGVVGVAQDVLVEHAARDRRGAAVPSLPFSTSTATAMLRAHPPGANAMNQP